MVLVMAVLGMLELRVMMVQVVAWDWNVMSIWMAAREWMMAVWLAGVTLG
jgi:hypothetical protein